MYNQCILTAGIYKIYSIASFSEGFLCYRKNENWKEIFLIVYFLINDKNIMQEKIFSGVYGKDNNRMMSKSYYYQLVLDAW